MEALSSASTTVTLPPPRPRSWLRELLATQETRLPYAILCVALWSVCFYLFITHFIGGTVEVQGESMMPTLKDGETYLLNRWSSRFRPPRPGEFVVIHDPGFDDLAIKRVIAVEKDRVEIHDSAVFVNGVKLREHYLPKHVRTFPMQGLSNSIVLPQDHFYVLGDNRGASVDSRTYGPIARSRIIGLVTPE